MAELPIFTPLVTPLAALTVALVTPFAALLVTLETPFAALTVALLILEKKEAGAFFLEDLLRA